jgi:hypothetical protein
MTKGVYNIIYLLQSREFIYMRKLHIKFGTHESKLCSNVSRSMNTPHQTLPIVRFVDYVANSDVLIGFS